MEKAEHEECKAILFLLSGSPEGKAIEQWLLQSIYPDALCGVITQPFFTLLHGRTIAECIRAGDYASVTSAIEALDSGTFI